MLIKGLAKCLARNPQSTTAPRVSCEAGRAGVPVPIRGCGKRGLVISKSSQCQRQEPGSPDPETQGSELSAATSGALWREQRRGEQRSCPRGYTGAGSARGVGLGHPLPPPLGPVESVDQDTPAGWLSGISSATV